MGMGAVLRRWRADGATAAAVAATVVTAMVMLAAGPIFADAVSVASLRQAVVAGSAGEVTVEVAIAGTERPGVDYDWTSGHAKSSWTLSSEKEGSTPRCRISWISSRLGRSSCSAR